MGSYHEFSEEAELKGEWDQKRGGLPLLGVGVIIGKWPC